MTSTAPIEPPEFDDTLADLPPMLSVVPVAGPAVVVYVGFGAVLLVLLVPPIALVATFMVVALVLATAVVALVALAAAIVEASFLVSRVLRGHPLGDFALPLPHIHKLRARRV